MMRDSQKQIEILWRSKPDDFVGKIIKVITPHLFPHDVPNSVLMCITSYMKIADRIYESPVAGFFSRPNTIVIREGLSKYNLIRVVVHEFSHMASYFHRNISILKYPQDVIWRNRTEEQAATIMAKALTPLVLAKLSKRPKKKKQLAERRFKNILRSVEGKLEALYNSTELVGPRWI